MPEKIQYIEKEKETVKKAERENAFETGEIATQTAMVIKNNSTGDLMNVEQSLVLILNKLEELKRGLL